MALNDTTIAAALEAWLDTKTFEPISFPPSTFYPDGLIITAEEQRETQRAAFLPIFKAICFCVRDNAVVSPDGTGTDMTAGGDSVTGTGKLL